MPASSAEALPPTRRTRIVCISDTHNSTIKLPKGDVLIHAGDITNQGSYSELSKAAQWLEKTDFEAKIVIAGNHDITLDHAFYSNHGSNFHNQNPQDPAKCLSLLTSSRTITYLQHGSATIRLTDPNGPRTQFTVFGSPYSPEYGTWAFNYRRADQPPPEAAARESTAAEIPCAADVWAAVPSDIDVLVTHTPAYTHCDDSFGCPELQTTLARVRPRLHVCGHVHQGRGAERVRWDTDGSVEASAESWEDPNPDPRSAKISLVDLTARGGNRALDFENPGPSPAAGGGGGTPELPGPAEDPAEEISGSSASSPRPGRSESAGLPASTSQLDSVDRTGRRETCVVNCAIVATGWPHTGGKRFNKPIVVDIDLPTWR